MKTAKRAPESPQVPARGEYLLTRRTLAALLSISTKTLDRMISLRQYPPPDLRLPDPETGEPRWRQATHDRWVKVRSGAEVEVET